MICEPRSTKRNPLMSCDHDVIQKILSKCFCRKRFGEKIFAVSSDGYKVLGLKVDVAQTALLLPSLVKQINFHLSLHTLEEKIGYQFKDKSLLQVSNQEPMYGTGC